MKTLYRLAATGLLIAAVTGCSRPPDPPAQPPQFLSTTAEFEDELVRYKIRRDRTQLAIDRLKQRKQPVVLQLQEMGVHRSADLVSTRQRLAAEELQRLVQGIAELQQQKQLYSDAIILMEAKLRDLERRAIIRGSAPGAAELEAVMRVKLDLEDQLTPDTSLVEEMDMDIVLKRELATQPATGDD